MSSPYEHCSLLYTNVVSGTGPTLTASGDSGAAEIDTSGYENVGLFVIAKGAVTGTTPKLNVAVDALDENGNAYFLCGLAADLTAQGTAAATSAGAGTASSFMPTRRARVTWTVQGTTPSFADVEIYVYGRRSSVPD